MLPGTPSRNSETKHRWHEQRYKIVTLVRIPHTTNTRRLRIMLIVFLLRCVGNLWFSVYPCQSINHVLTDARLRQCVVAMGRWASSDFNWSMSWPDEKAAPIFPAGGRTLVTSMTTLYYQTDLRELKQRSQSTESDTRTCNKLRFFRLLLNPPRETAQHTDTRYLAREGAAA